MNRMAWLGILALIAAPLAAQQPDTAKKPMMGQAGMMGHEMGGMQGHMDQMMMQMMGPMMRAMAFTPDHLLARKDTLGLSAQQVTRLTALRDAAKTAHDAAAAEAQTHMNELQRVMAAAAPDTAQLKAHFQAAHAAMGKAHWAMLSAAAQARAVLTEGQRGRVEGWADAMMGHQGGMPEHRPMHHPERR